MGWQEFVDDANCGAASYSGGDGAVQGFWTPNQEKRAGNLQQQQQQQQQQFRGSPSQQQHMFGKLRNSSGGPFRRPSRNSGQQNEADGPSHIEQSPSFPPYMAYGAHQGAPQPHDQFVHQQHQHQQHMIHASMSADTGLYGDPYLPMAPSGWPAKLPQHSLRSGASVLAIGAIPPAPPAGMEAVSRILVPNAKIGAVIGKAGAIVKFIRDISLARVTISDADEFSGAAGPGGGERMIVIAGTFTAVMTAFVAVLAHAETPSNGEPLPGLGNLGNGICIDPADPNAPAASFRMLIPNGKAGALIGRGGCTIKAIRDNSSARIEISSQLPPGLFGPGGAAGLGLLAANMYGAPASAAMALGFSADRAVAVSGSFGACIRAHHMIAAALLDPTGGAGAISQQPGQLPSYLISNTGGYPRTAPPSAMSSASSGVYPGMGSMSHIGRASSRDGFDGSAGAAARAYNKTFSRSADVMSSATHHMMPYGSSLDTHNEHPHMDSAGPANRYAGGIPYSLSDLPRHYDGGSVALSMNRPMHQGSQEGDLEGLAISSSTQASVSPALSGGQFTIPRSSSGTIPRSSSGPQGTHSRPISRGPSKEYDHSVMQEAQAILRTGSREYYGEDGDRQQQQQHAPNSRSPDQVARDGRRAAAAAAAATANGGSSSEQGLMNMMSMSGALNDIADEREQH